MKQDPVLFQSTSVSHDGSALPTPHLQCVWPLLSWSPEFLWNWQLSLLSAILITVSCSWPWQNRHSDAQYCIQLS